MQNNEAIPHPLQDVYNVLSCAFPEGIPDEEYWPLIAVLHERMSFWVMADLLPALTHKHRSEVHNDASGFGVDPLPAFEEVEKVRLKLRACGYEELP